MRVLSITAKQKVMPVMAIISAAHNPRILPNIGRFLQKYCDY